MGWFSERHGYIEGGVGHDMCELPVELPPAQIWWKSVLADAYRRHLTRVGVIKHAARRTPGGGHVVMMGKMTKDGRANPTVTRTLRATLDASGFKLDKLRRPPKLQLIFDLALWGEGKKLPKKSLSKYKDDEKLWEILSARGEIDFAKYVWWSELPAGELNRLETRLHQHWPIVARVAEVISRPRRHLEKANAVRRIPKRAKLNTVKLTPAAYLGYVIS